MILRKIFKVPRQAEKDLTSLDYKKLVEKRTDSQNLIKKIYQRKKLKLRSSLQVGEEVLRLAARLIKKDSLEKCCKSSVNKRSYFHKQETFLIKYGKFLYCLKSSRTETN